MLAAPGAVHGQLRVCNQNITNYNSDLIPDLQNVYYGEFEGRSMRPDVVITEEFINQDAVDTFLMILNTAPTSPGDWAAAPFVNGADTDTAFFYRTSRATLLATTVVSVGSSATNNHPRNIMRYDIRISGYSDDSAVLACYGSHMKSGSASSDQARRLVEAIRIRDDAELLTPAWHFLLGGDFNIQSSSQAAYVELVGSQVNNNGRLFDPIRTPGTWNNNSAFRFVHTQDPIGAGGMDDRHDQILLELSLLDGVGFDYIGSLTTPYSTTTWNDPNHSYRAWGNDGTSFNLAMTTTGNQMVGPSIAQDIRDAASGGGHLPVFLDLRVPAKIDSGTTIDFGQVAQSSLAEEPLQVVNAGDVALWTAAGLANLNYTLQASAGFTAPGGSFQSLPGSSANVHVIAMDTSAIGPMVGTITILSDSPEEPSRIVSLVGEVVSPCTACDANCDTFVDMADLDAFADQLVLETVPCSACAADVNSSGLANGDDIAGFVNCIVTP
jgi:hypothetical protein